MSSNHFEENSNVEDEYLYPIEILSKLDVNSCYVHFKPPISIAEPGENLVLRPLSINDYHKGYLDLLSQLTVVGEVSEEKFKETFREMKRSKNRYFITVIEDLTKNQVIGSATLAVEKKFIHSAGLIYTIGRLIEEVKIICLSVQEYRKMEEESIKRGRLEDVVVSNDYRGKQLGKLVVITIRLLAEHIGCYKITLDCKDKMVDFYKQFGFVCETGNNNMMTVRFKS